MFRFLFITLFFSVGNLSCRLSPNKDSKIPAAAYQTFEHIQKHHRAPKGYVGGRKFGNYDQLLPKTNAKNESLRYKEWDIYPRKKGENRGAERIVTSSEGNAYYTADHYHSFTKLED
jgi:ribonuclease T1